MSSKTKLFDDGRHMLAMPVIPNNAPCAQRGIDPDDWEDPLRERINGPYEGTDHSRYRDEDRAAEKLCEGCPVLTRCGEWGIAHDQQTGVLGGLTRRKRRHLRRKAIKAAQTTGVSSDTSTPQRLGA